jgi:hypothetical protein
MGDPVAPHILWNDPSVLKEDGQFRMWLSGGDARNLTRIPVSIYEAYSPDGLHWRINPAPVLEPGPPSAWDGLRTETPSVIKAKSVYHLYYTGFDESGARSGISSIGHATSIDGRSWVKDPQNPVLKGQTSDPFRWGYGGVGEPCAFYDEATDSIYLYYVGLRYSPANPKVGHIAVLLAVSRDGSSFTPVLDVHKDSKVILFRDVPGAIDGAWFGYSSPSATRTPDGKIHLFAAFVVAPGGPATARNVLIAHAVSLDFENFTLQQEMILRAGLGDWKDHQVGAPSVLEENGRLLLWYAGQRANPFFAGIGLLSAPPPN